MAGGHPATVDAAIEILEAGGNAFDATLAGGFAATVAEPCLTSLAGGGFLTAMDRSGDAVVVDFFVAAPGLGDGGVHDPDALVAVPVDFGGVVQDFHVGPASVGVPGVLAGYLHVHERWGRLELERIVTPAIRLCRTGVVLDPWQAHLLELLAPILNRSPAGRMLFSVDGRQRGEGESIANAALGDFLADVASGARSGFRSGELGAGVSAEDLAAYEVVQRSPLVASHRSGRLLVNPAPSFGGRLVAYGLEALADAPPLVDESSVDATVALAASIVALADRRRELGEGTSRGTTQLSVSDAEGNLVSMTTSNGSGSGEFAGDLGVQLNNMMGESDLHPRGFGTLAPGARIGSMMAPGILADGARRVALGSGGSQRIRSTLTQLVVRLVDGPAPLRAAVEAPRLHWDSEVLQVEPGLPAEVLAALAERWPLNVWDRRDLYFGGAHLAADDAEVAGDPRRGGVGRVVEP